MDPIRCDNIGLGLTINDGDVDVLLSTGTEDQPVYVVLAPEVAQAIGVSMLGLAVEASVLQEKLAAMEPEQLEEYLKEVQRRNARGLN